MRRHRFHRDHGGHSVTVFLRQGLHTEAELLVDGKEVGSTRLTGRGPWTLDDSLPEDPPVPFTVRISPSDPPVCVLEVAGAAHPMPPVLSGR
ncbi:hypothetical protein GCM10020229_00760 [Kitasatospora albolonga]|uniref:hypothetical protein n=1 Tax=Kitasatospora albolonga TaxID=68173 RepID=UPI0031EB30CA